MARKYKNLNIPPKRVYKLVSGEVLRFRDKNGRLTKFDGRKKLTSEIWIKTKYVKGKKTKYKVEKTNRTLNKISKGKIIPEKFPAKKMSRRIFQQSATNKAGKIVTATKSLKITIDARYPISDNLEMKADSMLSDIVKFTKKKLVTHLSMDFEVLGIYKSINTYIRGLNKGLIALEISRFLIARLYSDKLRMSGIKKSDLGDRAEYVRTLKVTFQYDAKAYDG